MTDEIPYWEPPPRPTFSLVELFISLKGPLADAVEVSAWSEGRAGVRIGDLAMAFDSLEAVEAVGAALVQGAWNERRRVRLAATAQLDGMTASERFA